MRNRIKRCFVVLLILLMLTGIHPGIYAEESSGEEISQVEKESSTTEESSQEEMTEEEPLTAEEWNAHNLSVIFNDIGEEEIIFNPDVSLFAIGAGQSLSLAYATQTGGGYKGYGGGIYQDFSSGYWRPLYQDGTYGAWQSYAGHAGNSGDGGERIVRLIKESSSYRQLAYCIGRGITINDGRILSVQNADYNSYINGLKKVNDGDQWDGILLASIYGAQVQLYFPGGNAYPQINILNDVWKDETFPLHDEGYDSRTFSVYSHWWMDHYWATEMLIWEFQQGMRDLYDGLLPASEIGLPTTSTFLYDELAYEGLSSNYAQEIYNWMVEKIRIHVTEPTGTASMRRDKAINHDLTYNAATGKYEKIITEVSDLSNATLEPYDGSSTVTAEIESLGNNQYKIMSSSADLDGTMFILRRNLHVASTEAQPLFVLDTGDSWQRMIVGKATKDPIGFYLTLTSDNKGTISGTKVKGSNGQSLAGAVLGLYSDEVCSNKLMEATSGSDGSFKFGDVTYGTYYVKEIKAPSGYQLNQEKFKVTVSRTNKAASVGNIPNDAYGWVKGLKQSTDGEAVAGAVMGLYNASGTLLQKVTTGSDGSWYFGNLTFAPAGTSYYVKEISAPTGYVLNTNQFSFTLSRTSPSCNMEAKPIVDQLQVGNIQITKKIETENYLPQIARTFTFDITGKTDRGRTYTGSVQVKIAAEGTSGSVKISNLEVGSYTVTERESGETVNFIIPGPQTKRVENGQTVSFSFNNTLKRGSAVLVKTDAEYPDKKLSGAVFEVWNQDTGKLAGVMTESKGQYQLSDLPLGSYYVTEKTAPDWYVQNQSKLKFTIGDAGESIQLQMENSPQTGNVKVIKKLEKYRPESMEAVDMENLKFQLTGTAYTGEKVDQVITLGDAKSFTAQGHTITVEIVQTSEEEAYLQIGGLRLGEYTVREVFTNEMNAYIEPAQQSITLNVADQTAEVTFENVLKKGSVTIHKHVTGDKTVPIQGAVLELQIKDYVRPWEEQPADLSLYEKDDNGYYQWTTLDIQTTSEAGTIVFGGLVVGEYRLVETKAPAGYQLLVNPVEFSLPYGDSQELEQEFYIGEKPILSMPSTGGGGDYSAIGMVMISCGMLMVKRRKGERAWQLKRLL